MKKNQWDTEHHIHTYSTQLDKMEYRYVWHAELKIFSML